MTLRRRRSVAAPLPIGDDARELAGRQEAEIRRMRRALDALPIGVVLADETGQTLVENVAARNYHGHAAVLVSEAVERQLRKALGGVVAEQTVEFIGPPRTVLVVQAIPTEDGGALLTIDDVSE